MAKKFPNDPNWAEKCAERMMRTLNTPPRHRNTVNYRKSFPKVTGKIIVSPDEFIPKVKMYVPTKLELALDNLTPLVVNAPQKTRRTRKGEIAFSQRVGIERHCRPKGRIHTDIASTSSNAYRPIRSMDLCREHRRILHIAQSGICGSCGAVLDEIPAKGSLDHVVPRSLGGVDELGNLLLMHKICNAKKTNDAPTGCEMIFLLAVNAKLGVFPVAY
jgi:5-methylcytosine-specific restriction endonuclease McrA